MADKFNLKKYYGQLGKLFNTSGPVIPKKIASKIASPGQVGVPVGTARAFLRHVNSSYASALASYGQYNRMARYSDYNEMESMAEISSGLDIYSDESCTKNEHGEIISVHSSDVAIKDCLYELFYDTLTIDFFAWSWIRNLCKYGDQFLMVDHHPDFGVLNLLPLPINEVEREEGFNPENPLEYRYRWITQGNRILEPWQVIHFRLLGNDNFLPYGASVLEPVRRVWRQLILMEDAVMVYRIVRSPERRVFYVNVGNVAPQDVPTYMNSIQTKLKRNMIVDADTGRVDLRYNPLSVDEDYFLPIRGENDGTRIETLAGGQFTGDIEDLTYIQNKLFAGLKIPKSYLGYESDISSKSTLSQEDVRFSRTIQRIQRVFVAELNKIALIHLWSKGHRGDDLFNFELDMANPSSIAEMQRLELWRTRFEVTSLAQEGMFDRDFIYDKLWKLTAEDKEGIREGRKQDKLFDLELDSIQPPVSSEETPTPAGSELPTPPESEALPPPPGEEAGAGPINASKDPNIQSVGPNDLLKPFGSIKKNKKSFPDLKNYVFNVDKTALDSKRSRSELERFKSAPFGESKKEEQIFNNRVDYLRKFAEQLEKCETLQNKTKKVLSD